jgi:hypothetical protein
MPHKDPIADRNWHTQFRRKEKAMVLKHYGHGKLECVRTCSTGFNRKVG